MYQHKLLAQFWFMNKAWILCPFGIFFPAHKTHVYFGQNVKLIYCLQRPPLTFSVPWHPPFAVLTYGCDKLSKSCHKQAELGSITVHMYNTSPN